jgi:hypothetical protein
MPKEIRNIGASVRACLQNLSRETGQSFELILIRYALERLAILSQHVCLCRAIRAQGRDAAHELVRGASSSHARS